MTVFGHSKQVSPRRLAQWFGVFSLSLSAGLLGGDFATSELYAQRVREISRQELQQMRQEAQQILEADTAQLLKLFKEKTSWFGSGIKAANGKTYEEKEESFLASDGKKYPLSTKSFIEEGYYPAEVNGKLVIRKASKRDDKGKFVADSSDPILSSYDMSTRVTFLEPEEFYGLYGGVRRDHLEGTDYFARRRAGADLPESQSDRIRRIVIIENGKDSLSAEDREHLILRIIRLNQALRGDQPWTAEEIEVLRRQLAGYSDRDLYNEYEEIEDIYYAVLLREREGAGNEGYDIEIVPRGTPTSSGRSIDVEGVEGEGDENLSALEKFRLRRGYADRAGSRGGSYELVIDGYGRDGNDQGSSTGREFITERRGGEKSLDGSRDSDLESLLVRIYLETHPELEGDASKIDQEAFDIWLARITRDNSVSGYISSRHSDLLPSWQIYRRAILGDDLSEKPRIGVETRTAQLTTAPGKSGVTYGYTIFTDKDLDGSDVYILRWYKEQNGARTYDASWEEISIDSLENRDGKWFLKSEVEARLRAEKFPDSIVPAVVADKDGDKKPSMDASTDLPTLVAAIFEDKDGKQFRKDFPEGLDLVNSEKDMKLLREVQRIAKDHFEKEEK